MPGRCEYYLFQRDQEENVQFQRVPTAQMFLSSPELSLPSCLMEDLGTSLSPSCLFKVAADHTRTQPSLFRRKGPSLQLSTHISCGQQIKLKTLPTPPAVFSCFMPYPMDVHQICLQVLMAMQLWHHFSLRNLCHVRDVSQILEFYQLRRAEPGPQLKNGGHSYSANLQLWDMGWRKALALP